MPATFRPVRGRFVFARPKECKGRIILLASRRKLLRLPNTIPDPGAHSTPPRVGDASHLHIICLYPLLDICEGVSCIDSGTRSSVELKRLAKRPATEIGTGYKQAANSPNTCTGIASWARNTVYTCHGDDIEFSTTEQGVRHVPT